MPAKLAAFALFLGLLLTIHGAAMAQTVIPHFFAGTASIQGATVPDGTLVKAKSSSASADLGSAPVSAGRYVLQVSKPPAGEKIALFVGEHPVARQVEWVMGEVEMLDLDGGSIPPPAKKSKYSGKAFLDEKPAPDGALAQVFSSKSSKLLGETKVVSGAYSLEVGQPPEGEELIFKLDNLKAKTLSSWEPDNTVELDMDVRTYHTFTGTISRYGKPANGTVIAYGAVALASADIRDGRYTLRVRNPGDTKKVTISVTSKFLDFDAKTLISETPWVQGQITELDLSYDKYHSFSGSVTINGSPAPDGTSIFAYNFDGSQLGHATVSSGRYEMVLPFPTGSCPKCVTFLIETYNPSSFSDGWISWQEDGKSTLDLNHRRNEDILETVAAFEYFVANFNLDRYKSATMIEHTLVLVQMVLDSLQLLYIRQGNDPSGAQGAVEAYSTTDTWRSSMTPGEAYWIWSRIPRELDLSNGSKIWLEQGLNRIVW
ncbi:MAG: hypothetical protein FJ316_03050 [SAR202 cluster bacterium]|nr:hypothetical protein [SAR202 cluster bacterium]